MVDRPGLDPVFFKISEVADKTRFSERTIYSLIASGQLASVKIGASRRIPAAALDAFVASLTAEADSAPAAG
jgi:excisionase family DNA binding protein